MTGNNDITLNDIRYLMESNDNFLFLTHASPDGDTIGSAFALAAAYDDKNIAVACADPMQKKLSAVADGVLLTKEEALAYKADFIVALDVAELHLLGGLEEYFGDRIDLKIDHHMTSVPYAAHNYVDSGASATGEIIYGIVKDAGRMNMKAANSIYSAISTDTGCFKFRNVTARTHRIAAELIDFGVDASALNAELFESREKGEISALRAVLDNLRFYYDNRVATVVITNGIRAQYGFCESDMSSLNSLPREIADVEVGVVIKQKEGFDDKYKISVRSGGEMDASALCSVFGGGGHRGAAGAEIVAESAARAEQAVLDELKKFYDK